MQYSKNLGPEILGLALDETVNEENMTENIGTNTASDVLEACNGSCPDADDSALIQTQGLVNDIECITVLWFIAYEFKAE